MGERVGGVSERRAWHRWRRSLVVLAAAAALGLGATIPALAADEPSYETRVVGGTAVPQGKYPFMASMQNDRPGTAPLQDHFCGATLIDANHVMTAAHCAQNIGNGVSTDQTRIVVGTTSLNGGGGQSRGVARISVHPSYRGGTSYDVAVIRLDSPVYDVTPIRLDAVGTNANEAPGRLERVAGWGSTRSGGRPVDRLREARPPIVSDATADRVYGARYTPAIHVAAGKKGVDTCQGDSGGPLFVPAGGGFRQVGITSFGIGCATKTYPGVYTEVSSRAIGRFIRAAQSR